MKHMHWSQTGATQGSAFRMHPLKIIGVVFTCIGLLFAVLGGAFMAANAALMPRVFTAEVWLANETPDELALPICGLVFGVIGLVFLIIGVIMLLVLRRQHSLREELERYGTRVQGVVTDVRIDHTYRVNGRSPMRIIVTATHPSTGTQVTVRSGPVWETALSAGDAVDVLFDPMDEKKHIVLLP